jgi:glycogen synthase
MVAPECAPAAKAGGLGDVVSGLSQELELPGNAVEIILPKYASLRYSDILDLQPKAGRIASDANTTRLERACRLACCDASQVPARFANFAT